MAYVLSRFDYSISHKSNRLLPTLVPQTAGVDSSPIPLQGWRPSPAAHRTRPTRLKVFVRTRLMGKNSFPNERTV